MIILLKSTKKTFWYKIAILVGFFFSILYQTRVFSDFFKKNIHFLGFAELSGIECSIPNKISLSRALSLSLSALYHKPHPATCSRHGLKKVPPPAMTLCMSPRDLAWLAAFM